MLGGLFVYKLIVIVILNGVAYRDVVQAEYETLSECKQVEQLLRKMYIPHKDASAQKVQYECQVHKRWQSVWSTI